MPRWLSPSKQKVLKAVLQGSVLLPYHAASETASCLARANTFRFATAYSANPQLSSAVVECITSVKSQLGPSRQPHFCQLLVTSDAYGSHVEYAPSVSIMTIECCSMQSLLKDVKHLNTSFSHREYNCAVCTRMPQQQGERTSCAYGRSCSGLAHQQVQKRSRRLSICRAHAWYIPEISCPSKLPVPLTFTILK